jgi:hypothetical protein
MTKIKTETFEQRIERLSQQVKVVGYVHSLDDRYTICLHENFPWIIRVYDKDKLVGYSEMKGDFEPSLREFVEDYLA